MKVKFTIVFVMLFFAWSLYSQEIGQRYEPKPGVSGYFDVSRPLTEIGPIPPKGASGHHLHKKGNEVPQLFEDAVFLNPDNALPKGDDPVWQKYYGSKGMSAPIVNFEGTRNSDNGSTAEYVAPPDTDGDVGPNHYFQMCNTIFQIFDKQGNSLFGPADNSTIWDGFIGDWTGTNDGDPIVLYDQQADRWLVSQFAVDTEVTGGTYWVLVAISTSANPLGSYYRYAFEFDDYPDYPKFGIWRDGYYLMVQHGNGTVTAAALNRSQMIAGTSPAQMVQFAVPSLPGSGFVGMLPSDNDGQWAPTGAPNYFVYFSDDAWGNDPVDRLKIWEFDVNWTFTWLSTLTFTTNLNTAAFSSAFGTHNQGIIPQPGTTQKLAVMEKALMNRLQYRNFGAYESMVCCHTVDVDGANRAGMRWYELRKTTGSWYIYQQGTYSPGTTDNYWMGSIAQNGDGDIALGFSVSSGTRFPSIHYTGRNPNDPLGEMTMGEQIIFAGANAQGGTARWGDYSMMSVDPSDDETFWYTNEYLGNFYWWGAWITQVASFSMGDNCAASGGCDEYISRVQFGSIDNTSGCGNYQNMTNLVNDLPTNATETITVTNGHPYAADQCGIWVDWNRDGDFSDANETITVSGTPGNGPYTANISVPSGVSLGECILRVRITYTGAVSPCGTTQFGEVEDYTINVVGPVPNYWTGAFNYYWHNANNWSLGHIPTADEDVVMTSAGYHPPSVSIYDDACNNLTIQSGAGLIIAEKTLTVNGNLEIDGNLSMNNAAGNLNVTGSVYWNSGSTAAFTAASAFRVYGNWNFNVGANANLAAGTVLFMGNITRYIRSYSSNCSFFNLGCYKSDGASAHFSWVSTTALTINGYVYTHPGAILYDDSPFDIIVKGDVNSNGSFFCTDGKIVLDGSNQSLKMNVGDYFNNLTFSQSGLATVNNALTNIIDVNGSVVIESGTFNLQDRTMYVGGNWTNNAGLSAFNEGTSRVVFNSSGHNVIKTSETFNIIEANMGAALRVDNAASNVICNQYDWTTGGIDVIAGTFTALDLVDSGLFGTYWCNPGGALNLTQNVGQYTDLRGEIHLFGGTMTVTGGSGQSYWPYFDNALIEMSGGVLDFKNNGIFLYNHSYTLTENITGGTIRTNGAFTGDRADFTPSGGTIELYGSNDVQLSHGLGSNLYNLLINKTASLDNSGQPGEEKLFDRKGNPFENGKANAVSATSNLVLFGDMTIQNGQLIAPSSIKLKGNWTNNVGTGGFTEGTGTVTFNNDDHQYCYGETFYALELNMALMDLHIPTGTTTTCQIYDWNSGELEIEGGTFIAYDLFDNGLFGKYYLTSAGGLLELHQDAAQFVDLCGRIVIVNGTMNVYGGNGYSYWPYNVNSDITMYGGVLDFKDNGILVDDNALALNDNIIGGVIRMSKGMTSYRSDFTPVGGEFEFYGSGDYGLFQANGSTLSNVKINKSAKDAGIEPSGEPEYDERSGILISDGGKSNTITLNSDLTITGNLNIAAGTFNLGSFSCEVTGTTDIYGTLTMNNVANDLTSYTINWNNGSNDNVTAGTFHSHEWRFNEGTNAMLGTGNTAYTYNLFFPNDSDAEFGNLVATPYSKISDGGNGKAQYPIRVSGNFTAQSGSTWTLAGTAPDLIVAGNSIIESGSTLSFIMADFINSGNLTLNGELSLESGSTATVNGDLIFPATGTLNVGACTFINNYNGAIASLAGTLMLSGGIVEFPNRSVALAPTFIDQIVGGTFRFGRSFAATVAGTFQPTGGTVVEFINASTGNYVQVIGDNYLYFMTLNKPGSSFQVYDNLTIKGNLSINAGILNSSNKTITIGGNWNNNVGTSAFAETTGKVIFNGSTDQWCTTEDFYILEMNKPFGLLYNTSYSTITCQIYDWVDGGLWISPGNFTAYDLADNGLYGTFAIYSGTMDLYQDGSQFVDVNGNIIIGNGGNMNVYGGSSDSWWSIDGNTHITMSGGTLDFKNAGIYVYNSPYFTFVEDITNGTIRTPGYFVVSNPGFTPSGGTVEMYGGNTVSLATNAGSSLNNLVINKSATKDDPVVNSMNRDGKFEPGTRGNIVIMNGNVNVNGNLEINSGELYSGAYGYVLTCLGNVNIGSGSTLKIWGNSQLKLNSELSINSGGSFVSSGDAGFETLVTRVSTGYYTFNVNSGGSISADSTIFEYMGTNGINVASGALVDVANAFNHCTFRNGGSGQTLLMINNDQELECTGAKFPANTWSGASNVTKWVNQGHITFIDYTGGFAGSAYEIDPFSRVDWFEPQLSASPLVLNVTPPAGSTTFNITSNLDWTITESLSWVQVTPMSGSNNATITVNYTRNSSLAARSGIITISAPDVPDVVVTINQAGATLSVTPSSQNVTAAAGATTFNVTSNTLWTASESTSWFTISPAGATGNGTITVTYDQNTSVSPRSGQITVSSTGLPNVVVTVNQAGTSASLTVWPTNQDVGPEAGTTTFGLTSNTGWNVSESVPWLTVAPMSGTGNQTLTVTYGENATGSSRQGSIVVTATGGVPVVTVTVTQESYPTHNIMLSTGWTGLSSYIMPANNDIVDVFSPVSSSFVIAQTMTAMYYPAGPVNTIGDWLSQSAYKVKMSNQAVLPVIGNEETNKTYALSTGWNLVPVIYNSQIDAMILFAGANLKILKDVAGFGIYWPEYGINTLGYLNPGEAYYANMNSIGSVTFPANIKNAEPTVITSPKFPDHPWNEVIVTPSSHQIAIVAEGMTGIQTGDVLGVFDESGNCFGVSALEVSDKNQVITAYANDGLSSGKNGFTDGGLMWFKLFRHKTGEVLDVAVKFDSRLPQQQNFLNEGLSAISSLKVSNVGIAETSASLIQIFPNPATEKVTISGIINFSTIGFYSSGGNLVKTIQTANVDHLTIDIEGLSKGVYQLRFTGSESSVYKKLIIN